MGDYIMTSAYLSVLLGQEFEGYDDFIEDKLIPMVQKVSSHEVNFIIDFAFELVKVIQEASSRLPEDEELELDLENLTINVLSAMTCIDLDLDNE